MKPIAVVIPWFGNDLKGGAEQIAWQIASRLAARGHRIEVLTTCCRSFLDRWSSNAFRAGKSNEGNILIRRFKVDRRHTDRFNEVNSMMLAIPATNLKPGLNPVPNPEAETFVNENINSTDLIKFLKKKTELYQAFLFLPYLYGPILNGVPAVKEKAFLQPCLHNEVYAYLPQVENIFRIAKRILFNSEGECLLARHLYGPGIIPISTVIGAGIELFEPENQNLPECIDSFDLTNTRYILYLGRRDKTKNVHLIVQAFTEYRKDHPGSNLNLILAGPGNESFSDYSVSIYDFGLVSEADKAALLSNCIALYQPSQNESYSRVIMEAWSYGKPVAVHRDCNATTLAVKSANGGWLAGDESEWKSLIEKVDQTDQREWKSLSENGKRYAQKFSDWNRVIKRYEKVLGLKEQKPQNTRRGNKGLKEVHQLTPGFTFGDAISNQTILIQKFLRQLGYISNIYAQFVDPSMASTAIEFKPKYFNPKAGLIYHHSIGSDLTDYAVKNPGPKFLIYHNITPAGFLKDYNPRVANLLEQGRVDLRGLARHFPYSAGDSAYNRAELVECGFNNPDVLPICVDPYQWNISADPDLMKLLQDGTTNLLFVGRIAPNKCQHHLIEAFAEYLNFDSRARLILVGEIDYKEEYSNKILQIIENFNLKSKVVITGKISDSHLLAIYRSADLYWSMSEHEGFGKPLIEAMWFDVPVLAYKSSAVPETLGIGGLMFTNKEDFEYVAALAKIIVHDNDIKSKILTAQRKRRIDFLPEAVMPKLEEIVMKMEERLL